MSNARPSSPGRAASEAVRPEQNIPKGAKTVEIGGKVFLETEMTNGNIRRTSVFPGDYEVTGKKAKKKG